ncbi:MAG: hypothetical protein JWM14_20 [Chitinophagaceae bacterium]|nr:hypothetical protein [Chitinophagaceae bacterium]
MKKIITTLLCTLSLFTQVQAQTPTTVSMGAAYGNNIWYSLENGNVGTAQSATNWDIALAATISTSSPIVTSVLFNPKSGTLFVAPNAITPVDDFADLDTAGMANTWTKLYNSDTEWGVGAFSQPGTGHPDYGWGTYDGVSHTGFAARRVYVIRYGNGSSIPYTYKKLYLSLAFAGGTYTITYDKLDGSDPHTATVAIADYSTKDFVYYSLANHVAIDREPANTAWDLLFTQYVSTSELYKSNPSSATPGAANQLVGGVLLNKNVTAAQASNVADRTTYQDAAVQTFVSDINTIGWDWKYLNATFAWETVSDTVYFIEKSNGDIYSLYFTSFGGTSTGNFNFTQQKVSTVTGVFGEASDKASLAVYPNPTASGNATVLYDFSNSNNAVLSVSDLTGNVVYTENIQSAPGLNAYTFSTSSLKTGLYVVSLTANGGVLQQKLMVK